MQPVKFLKFLRQFVVLVERNLQLIWNDKLLLASLTLQSPFMVLVVKLTADPNCFTSNLVNIGSRTALFILAAMATFMGTLNSYREICREREIILREASVGVSLPAVVLSKAASIRDGKPVPMEMSIQSPLFTTRAASSAVHSLRLYSAV